MKNAPLKSPLCKRLCFFFIFPSFFFHSLSLSSLPLSLSLSSLHHYLFLCHLYTSISFSVCFFCLWLQSLSQSLSILLLILSLVPFHLCLSRLLCKVFQINQVYSQSLQFFFYLLAFLHLDFIPVWLIIHTSASMKKSLMSDKNLVWHRDPKEEIKMTLWTGKGQKEPVHVCRCGRCFVCVLIADLGERKKEGRGRVKWCCPSKKLLFHVLV